jgi:hypothetical protein
MKLSLAALLACSLAACAAAPDGTASDGTASSSANETASSAVRFGTSSWDPTWGSVKAGDALTIDYDFDRLPECRNQSTLDSWVIEASYRFDGGDVQKTVLDGSPGAGSTSNVIRIPEGAKTIELWFENHAVGGYDHCSAFDSKFGANYTYKF